ncbi:glycosyltransferase family 1 protein [Flavobacterium sp. CYK-55]|uniref:glycosyltransferase n=1 Tax=Flavobacterium sp. CYK-55 TaxID=2835529 RepID=UPI001BCD1F4F|nr:glycosyltransferase [Flavobacterium sp. CYK-55]MBS7788108.1 glycosyltransferase family 1 protein [Flavobacterium sp. CYK-55]
MKILLVGEYSRLHNSLKEGLVQLGHEVVIVGFKDGFKNFPVDLPLYQNWSGKFSGKIKNLIFRLTGFDLNSYGTYLQIKRYHKKLRGFDVVQLINENTFYCTPFFEKKILHYLFKNNVKTFLLCCGTDYPTINYYYQNPQFKSLLQPYLDGKIDDISFQNVLKYRKTEFKKLHDYIYKNIVGVLASDLDYHIPMQNHPKYLGMIPNPINIEKLPYHTPEIKDKIVIYHGINDANYYKKGNDYFEKALEIIAEKYGDRVEIETTRSVPYATYINLYQKAHILLDMVYSHDQGYHALEAMAQGKVVFTGAEKEFEQYYHLAEKVNINACPDVNYLVEQLSYLIDNPSEIEAISQRARSFVEREHNYINIAKQYLKVWSEGYKKL